MARVLVTDSDSRSALAATRALGRSGHEVWTAGTSKNSLAAVSRYSRGFFQYPDPAKDAEGFCQALVDVTHAGEVDVVLPMTEITTLLATQVSTRLPPHCLPFPAVETVATAADKAAVLTIAKSIGVPVPATQILADAATATDVAGTVSFPAVIKPSRSRVRVGAAWHSTGTTYAHGPNELVSRLRAIDPALFPVLVQERIVGAGVGVFVCCERGVVKAMFQHQRVREKPPSGGVSVLRTSVPLTKAAADHAKALMAAIGWHGVAMIEFKRDDRDGSLRLMEINGRFWGSLQLAIDAGVDFASMAVNLAMNRETQPIETYRVGTTTRWLWGDVDVLLSILLHSRRSLNLPANHPGKLGSLMQFCRFAGRDLHYEVESLDDPRPGLLEARRWLFGR